MSVTGTGAAGRVATCCVGLERKSADRQATGVSITDGTTGCSSGSNGSKISSPGLKYCSDAAIQHTIRNRLEGDSQGELVVFVAHGCSSTARSSAERLR